MHEARRPARYHRRCTKRASLPCFMWMSWMPFRAGSRTPRRSRAPPGLNARRTRTPSPSGRRSRAPPSSSSISLRSLSMPGRSYGRANTVSRSKRLLRMKSTPPPPGFLSKRMKARREHETSASFSVWSKTSVSEVHQLRDLETIFDVDREAKARCAVIDVYLIMSTRHQKRVSRVPHLSPAGMTRGSTGCSGQARARQMVYELLISSTSVRTNQRSP